MKFRHPQNGLEMETSGGDTLFSLFLGPFWFMIRGAWGAAVIYLLAGVVLLLVWPLLIILHIGMAIAAPSLIARAYRMKGWQEVGPDETAAP